MCSKYAHHSRLNSEHDLEGGPIWPLNEHEKISTLITNKIFTLSPQIYEENDCLLRHVYCNWTCNYRTRLVIQPDLPLEEGEAVVVNCRNLTHGVDLYKHSGVTHLIQKSNQNSFPARKDIWQSKGDQDSQKFAHTILLQILWTRVPHPPPSYGFAKVCIFGYFLE